jgi:hypothetical protein
MPIGAYFTPTASTIAPSQKLASIPLIQLWQVGTEKRNVRFSHPQVIPTLPMRCKVP